MSSLTVDLCELSQVKKTSVTFMEHDNINKSLEYSDETDALVRNEWRNRKLSRPRMTSVFHMTDSTFAGGIVTRANYMTRCFQTAWETNTADIPSLQSIFFWRGDSSQQTAWRAILGLIMQWLVPFLPVVLLVPPVQKSHMFQTMLWIILIAEFLMLTWHLIVFIVLIYNSRNWKRAWFTFEVPIGTIGLVDSGESTELTLFHFSANIRFIKANFSTIKRLHTISKHEQEVLEQNTRIRKLETSEVILYTEDFINCYSRWPKYMTMCLLIVTLLSIILTFVLFGMFHL